jgi:predicted methyltransferase
MLADLESSSIREEVEAAGFVLATKSTMLANKDDPYSIKVFDPSSRARPIASPIGL